MPSVPGSERINRPPFPQLLIASLCAGICLVAGTSRASEAATQVQSTSPSGKGDQRPPELQNASRFRFGIGAVSGAMLLNTNPYVEGAPTLGGLELRLGMQINDWVAVLSELSGTLLLPDFRAGVLVEATPIRYLSLAAGLGIETLPFLIAKSAINDNATAVEVPVRLAFNLPLSALATNSARRWRSG